MVSREELKKIADKMVERGYIEWSHTLKGDEIDSMFFLPKIDPERGIRYKNACVTVYPKEDGRHEFRLHRVVNPGCIEISSSKMSSIFDEDFYELNEKYIEHILLILKNEGFDV